MGERLKKQRDQENEKLKNKMSNDEAKMERQEKHSNNGRAE